MTKQTSQEDYSRLQEDYSRQIQVYARWREGFLANCAHSDAIDYARIEAIVRQSLAQAKPQAPALRVGPEEICLLLGIGRTKLRKMMRRHEIPFERFGPPRGRSTVFFDPQAVARALERRRSRVVGE
jgi:excisionase family DNA binding protein